MSENSRVQPKTHTARERVEALLADEDLAKLLPRIVGKVMLSQQFEHSNKPEEEYTEASVAIREGFDNDPTVTLVYLPDLLDAAIKHGASEEYLRSQLGRTGLKPHQAPLRFPKDPKAIILFEPEINGQLG